MPDPNLPKPLRSLWREARSGAVKVIDQRHLPHHLCIQELKTVDGVIDAIRTMVVRGAPLIGATAAYGVYLAACRLPPGEKPRRYLERECRRLKAARPTAVNLMRAVDEVHQQLRCESRPQRWPELACKAADAIAAGEVDRCRAIGENGVDLIEAVSRARKGAPVNVLTHCNAGWLATMAYGTATAPVYAAHGRGIAVHVWVDETRPLNQGARLTAWELRQGGVPHTVITDNCGGHLMQHGLVDLVIVGSDRTTAQGDVANKIGTYLKALAAKDTGVPFYVALPSTTFDWEIGDGLAQIPIELRDPREVHYVCGNSDDGLREVRITPLESTAANYAFDVTPARLVTEFITERGRCPASADGIRGLFPEYYGS